MQAILKTEPKNQRRERGKAGAHAGRWLARGYAGTTPGLFALELAVCADASLIEWCTAKLTEWPLCTKLPDLSCASKTCALCSAIMHYLRALSLGSTLDFKAFPISAVMQQKVPFEIVDCRVQRARIVAEHAKTGIAGRTQHAAEQAGPVVVISMPTSATVPGAMADGTATLRNH